jgi:hypothetical protein
MAILTKSGMKKNTGQLNSVQILSSNIIKDLSARANIL